MCAGDSFCLGDSDRDGDGDEDGDRDGDGDVIEEDTLGVPLLEMCIVSPRHLERAYLGLG